MNRPKSKKNIYLNVDLERKPSFCDWFLILDFLKSHVGFGLLLLEFFDHQKQFQHFIVVNLFTDGL